MTPARHRARAVWAIDQTALRMRIRELPLVRPRFGYARIWVLLRREGWLVNKKRVRRLYRLEGLQVRMRVRRRKHMALHRGPAPAPTGPGQGWSIDVEHDQLFDGRPFRVLTVVDQWSRQSPILECGFSLTGRHVVSALDAASHALGLPASITEDHGTEIMSKALEASAFFRGVQLDVTRPGKPTDNSHIESFNGKFWDECLYVHQFHSLDHARARIEAWRRDYNEHRPRSALGDLTPTEFMRYNQERTAAEPAPLLL